MIYPILFLLFILPFRGEDRLETANAIHEVSREFGFDIETTQAWMFLIAQESAFNPKIVNKSSGAMGIGQVMPQYLEYFRKKIKDLSADPKSLYGGLRMSAWVFNDCYSKFPTKLGTWACYYSGPNHACTRAVYRLDFTRQCPNTYKHVIRIAKRYNKYKMLLKE